MAKKDTKKTKKSKKASKPAERLRTISDTIEAQGFESAHKIWLAGVGAYGKAYDVAAENFNKVSDQSADMFDELVKRGEVIENDVRARIEESQAYSRVSEQIEKVGEQISKARGRVNEATEDLTDSVAKFQDEQRERLEERMERMREALGLNKGGKGKKTEKFHSKLDQLEEEVASLRATAGSIDAKVRQRVERLANEIAAFAGLKKDKPAAKKASAKKPAAKKSVKKVAPKAKKAATPKTDANGRLKAPIGVADDLKAIRGVGLVLEKKLNESGIFHFWQLAGLTAAQIKSLEEEMRFPGRIARDAWKAQATALAK